MTTEELARELRRTCDRSPSKGKVTAIHLFGIRYAAELEASHVSVQKVAELGAEHNYGSEIHKGMNLAKYVELNDDAMARYWAPQ